MSLSPLAEHMVSRFSSVGEALLCNAVFNAPNLFKTDKSILEVSNMAHDTAIQFSTALRLHVAMKHLPVLPNEDRIWRLLNTGHFSCRAETHYGEMPIGFLFSCYFSSVQPSVALVRRLVEEAPETVNRFSYYTRPISRLPMVQWYYTAKEYEELEKILKPTE